MAAPSVTTLYQAKLNLEGGLLAAVSQSGESTDTNVVLEEAKRQGAFTVGITNEASSTLAKISDFVALVRAGREKSVAATKTYTGQMMAFYLLAWALGADLDIDDLRRLPGWGRRCPQTREGNVGPRRTLPFYAACSRHRTGFELLKRV